MDIKEKLAMLPDSSGVYKMYDASGKIIYVGKARVLKNRVRQYFHSSSNHTEKVKAMMLNVVDFDYIITNSEYDALTLECNLIKKYKPRYNILLKDDKAYPYIKINLNKEFPKFEITRKIIKDRAKYFGPFNGGVRVNDLLEIIRSTYAIPDCKINILKPPKNHRPCLNYYIKRCSAPCAGYISRNDYMKSIDAAIAFLKGQDDNVEKILYEKMIYFSDREEFESAISYRDKLQSLKSLKKRKLINFNDLRNFDIIAIAGNGFFNCVSMLFIRGGKMTGSINKILDDDGGLNLSVVLSSYIRQYYETELVPDETYINVKLEDSELLQQWLKNEKGINLHLKYAQKGQKHELVEMAEKNALDYLETHTKSHKNKLDFTIGACMQLQEQLNLRRPPMRMECYDISNTSGLEKVASMVVFYKGEPFKSHYRKFKIKTVEGIDDFKSMHEVISRRIKELNGSDVSFSSLPDLIVIDGGKGQLSSAVNALGSYEKDIDIISLAKREEEVFKPGCSEPVVIPHSFNSLKLLQRIRDEAHRFAITYHKKLRLNKFLSSELDKIPGVGKNRKIALIKKFKTVEGIKNASLNDIKQIERMPESVAQTIFDYFSFNGDINK